MSDEEQITHEATLEAWAALCFFAAIGMLANSALKPPQISDEDRNRLLQHALPLLRKMSVKKE